MIYHPIALVNTPDGDLVWPVVMKARVHNAQSTIGRLLCQIQNCVMGNTLEDCSV
jgi:hypothetical protein